MPSIFNIILSHQSYIKGTSSEDSSPVLNHDHRLYWVMGLGLLNIIFLGILIYQKKKKEKYNSKR
ncbi:hypothetical protein [Aquimarina sediminis]|uniref:hypothetical protein n=1 Tax=Aquimarina sediminis TaxID=2070536 RepID=UPI000FFEAD4F|nr:hypothetical protein [Aquimarina sediminis]